MTTSNHQGDEAAEPGHGGLHHGNHAPAETGDSSHTEPGAVPNIVRHAAHRAAMPHAAAAAPDAVMRRTGISHSGHDRHAGHSVTMFRDRFWIAFLLTLPTLMWGHMLQGALGYNAPTFPGASWIPAVFGSAVFLYGGVPS